MADEAILLCGCDFRLHGRDWSTGLDCIGLTGLCLSAAGSECTIPSGYSIRSGDIDSIGLIMEQAGFEKISHDDHPGEGDVLLTQPSPVQFHFMIRVSQGFVHAHAGVGKVVFTPDPCPWPVLAVFRIRER